MPAFSRSKELPEWRDCAALLRHSREKRGAWGGSIRPSSLRSPSTDNGALQLPCGTMPTRASSVCSGRPIVPGFGGDKHTPRMLEESGSPLLLCAQRADLHGDSKWLDWMTI